MSGISTVAIKDGHEGSRRHNADAAAERLTRLAALDRPGSASSVTSAVSIPPSSAPDYFVDEEVRKVEQAGEEAGQRGEGKEEQGEEKGVGKQKRRPLHGKHLKHKTEGGNASDPTTETESTSSGREKREEARMVGGVVEDGSVIDTTVRTPREV